MKNFELNIRKRISEAIENSDIENETFEFFWETSSPFSQWHKCSFNALPILKSDKFNTRIHFTSAEQFMMLHKALLFNDTQTATMIMKTSNVREQKRLGRMVSNFNDEVWNAHRVGIVYEGNKHKFIENEKLLSSLSETKGKTLVEASPDDQIWGIGLFQDDSRAYHRESWLGTNFLGDVLTALRIELTGKY